MVVSGIIKQIDIEDNKKVFIEVIINTVDAILYNGENLIDDPEPYYINKNNKLGIYENYIEDNMQFFKTISKHKITGFIRKHDVCKIKLDI
jgi:hypothetical protein